MDAVADLGAEHVVDEPVLRDSAEAHEGRRGDDSAEMATVTGHLDAGLGNRRLDPLLELLGSCSHVLKRSEKPWLYFMKQ